MQGESEKLMREVARENILKNILIIFSWLLYDLITSDCLRNPVHTCCPLHIDDGVASVVPSSKTVLLLHQGALEFM
jgi:hypothetical protein